MIAGKLYSAGDTWNGIAGVISINKDEWIGTPRYITYFQRIKSYVSGISCGEFHCLAFTDKGRVFSWGKATDGALGFELPE